MPPNVEPTEQVLLDVTQRLQAMNRSQTSLFSVTSSRSMPVAPPSSRRLSTKHSCDLCLKQCSSSTQLQFHRQTHVVENMAVRLKSNKAAQSPEGLKAKEGARQRDLDVLSLGLAQHDPPPTKGKLESLLSGGRQKIRRGKAHIAPKAHISTFFAGRKGSQRSASSGDSGYESMDRPDPVASLLGMKTKEAKHEEPMKRPGVGSRNTSVGSEEVFVHTAYFSRRRSDEINKFKRFSKQLERKPILKQRDTIIEDVVAEYPMTMSRAAVNSTPGVPQRQEQNRYLQEVKDSKAVDIAMSASAMSSTDDILGELVSPTSYRSRMESCRQSGASMSDGELSFMGIRPPSIYSVNLRETSGDNLAERLAQNVLNRCLDMQSQRAIRSRTASRQGSNQSTPPVSARHTPATSMSSTSKRSRGKDEGSEDPDDEDARRRDSESKRSRTEAQHDLKLFACPYSKFDPQRFSELNVVEKEYRRCSCCYLRDIPRLKQHLYRVHRRPEYYCGSCFESFKSRDMLDVHARQRPSCELKLPKFEEKMTDDQLNSIKRRIVKGDPCELWFNIFKTLFPTTPRPLSPYASDNDPTSVNHFVTLFRWFGPEELFNLMRDRREQQDGTQPLDGPTQAIVDEAFEIALPTYLQYPPETRMPFTSGLDCMHAPVAPIGFAQTASASQTSAPAPVPSASGQLFPNPQTLSFEHNVPSRQGWTDANFDPTEVLHAFDSYNSVVTQPLPKFSAADNVVDDFFDYARYRYIHDVVE